MHRGKACDQGGHYNLTLGTAGEVLVAHVRNFATYRDYHYRTFRLDH